MIIFIASQGESRLYKDPTQIWDPEQAFVVDMDPLDILSVLIYIQCKKHEHESVCVLSILTKRCYLVEWSFSLMSLVIIILDQSTQVAGPGRISIVHRDA